MKTLLFDLDGTLINTKRDIALAVNKTLEILKLPQVTKEVIFSHLGYGPGRLIVDCMGSKVDPHTQEKGKKLFSQVYFENLIVHTALYDGMERVLDSFSPEQMAIVTNKSPLHTFETVKKLNLSKWFSVVWAKPTNIEHKPHPFPIIDTLKQMGRDKIGAVLIGDTEADIQAGKRAGIATCGITWGYRSKDFIENLNPDYIAHTPNDLLSFFL
jgi:phosphoglycolate phosphatase